MRLLPFVAGLVLVACGSEEGSMAPEPGDETQEPIEEDPGESPSAPFQEVGGYVVMEAESAAIGANIEWQSSTTHEGFTGDGYYEFVGNGICNGPASSPLRYDFAIQTAADYELRLRMTKTFHCVDGEAKEDGHCKSKGDCDYAGPPTAENACLDVGTCFRDDLSNDVFVHVEDGDGNYVAWTTQPENTVGDPIKLFVGGGEDWRFSGQNSLDVNHEKWAARWSLAPGTYTLVVQGRSQLTRLDRLVFFDSEQHSFSAGDLESMSETRSEL